MSRGAWLIQELVISTVTHLLLSLWMLLASRVVELVNSEQALLLVESMVAETGDQGTLALSRQCTLMELSLVSRAVLLPVLLAHSVTEVA